MLKNRLVFFVLLAFCINATGQETFLETPHVINDLLYNPSSNEIIFANDVSLYFADYETLKVKDSIQLINIKNKYISSFEYLDTPQPLIIIKTRTKGKFYRNFFEYPEDSTYFYNRTQRKIANKLAGNFYVSFNYINPMIATIGLNKYYDYKDDYGNVNKSPAAGELQALPDRKVVPSSGVVRNIKVNNEGDKVAIVYYKYFGAEVSHDHILELRSLPDLGLINSKKLKDRTTSIYFSEKDDFIVLKKDANPMTSDSSLSTEEYFQVFNASNLEEISELPKDLKIKGAIENGTVWKQVNSEIINEDFTTKKKKQQIWSNLTPFSVIDGFVKTGNGQVLLYGNKGYGLAGEKHGIFKFQLKDEAIYSEVKTVSEIDSLYNPLDAKIMDNKVAVNAVQFSPKNNLLLIEDSPKYELNGFQIWSSLDKMKLYDIEFSENINPFLDNEGKYCLIFEEYQGKNYGDFKLKVLDIETGIAKVNLFVGADFKGLNAKCHNLKTKNNEWICSDGYAKFWIIDTNDLSVKLLTDLSNSKYYRTDVETFRGIPDSDKVLVALQSVNVAPNHNVTESHFEGYKILDANSGYSHDVSVLKDKTDVFPLSEAVFILKDKKNLEIYNKDSGNISSILELESNTKISKVLQLDNRVDIGIDKTDRYSDSLTIVSYHLKNSSIIETYKIPSSYGLYKTYEGLNYFLYNDAYYTFNKDLNARVRWNNHKPKFTQPHDLIINKEGKLLYRGEWIINLETLEVEDKLLSFTDNVLLDNNRILMLDNIGEEFDSKNHKFRIVSAKNTDSILWESKTIKIAYNENPNTRVWTNDKNYILFYNNSQLVEKQNIYLIDLKNKRLISKRVNQKIKKAVFAEESNRIALIPHSKDFQKNDKSRLHNLSDLKFVKELNTKYDDEIDMNNYIYTDYEFLIHNVINDDSVVEKKTYYARQSLTTSKYLKSKNIIVAGTDNGSLVFWDLDISSPKHVEKISDSEIIGITQVKNQLYVLSKDSGISVVNLDNLELKVTCKIFEKDEYISLVWITPNGFFKASKSDIRNFHFVRKGKALPLVDYEVFLNRPDLIMENLGFASPKLYGLYKEAYLKRLTRNGYDESTDIFSLNRPKLKLLNRAQIPILSEYKQLNLNIENTSKAKELLVYINGVPTNKEVISDKQEINISIDLNNGINRVSILTKNEIGLESDPVTFEITSTAPRTKSKLYYIGIGVSKYQDSSMNLRYADKDVERISEVLTSKYEDRSYSKKLLNEDVNKTDVNELKTVLQTTDIDDTVIISFSGHGLIGKDNEFYFATYDMDFDAPEKHGISYTEIQNLLTDIPARRKLLLIDACHSGELDTTDNNKTLETKVVEHIPEGAKGSKAKSKGATNKETFRLMQTLFFDSDRGNGAYVISAAGGSEFAYEDDEWKNGVFTYSFINALNDLGYDTWSGEEGIPISKLKTYVYEKVKELTNNMQRPTSRAENLEWDWVLE
ncbi:caspase family protein [Winogradskyella ouciana]|uniref:Peptidase C14 caspase domain-containing protein n=1 Tax=Winogradskyella ouciana TaxID=2608631 RepID=A0A7K1GG02_9FLAO|nr:caspase family protein [Winogradskyella ouciana]MTE28247.1 hypothetical protein [Winogradskyella ouciana]